MTGRERGIGEPLGDLETTGSGGAWIAEFDARYPGEPAEDRDEQGRAERAEMLADADAAEARQAARPAGRRSNRRYYSIGRVEPIFEPNLGGRLSILGWSRTEAAALRRPRTIIAVNAIDRRQAAHLAARSLRLDVEAIAYTLHSPRGHYAANPVEPVEVCRCGQTALAGPGVEPGRFCRYGCGGAR